MKVLHRRRRRRRSTTPVICRAPGSFNQKIVSDDFLFAELLRYAVIGQIIRPAAQTSLPAEMPAR